MSDLLIRNIAPSQKKDIEKRAEKSKRSLSDEIKHLISLGLLKEKEAKGTNTRLPMGQALRAAFADCMMSDEEHAQFTEDLEEHRKEPPRPFTDFE